MGLSFSGGSQKSQQNQNTSSAATYSPEQSSLQSMLGSVFSTLIPSLTSGTLSPNTAAAETASANQINQNYASAGSNTQKQLAARGFGSSGQSGTATLQTELGRQGALAGNTSAAANSQLSQNNSSLLDALQYAFTNIGSSGSSAGSSSGSNFGWGASGSAAFGFGG